MKTTLLSLLLFLGASQIFMAQSPEPLEDGPDTFFQNELSEFEGFPAPLFVAPDVEGNKHYLDYYSDHIVILHFCQISSEPCVSQIPSLNRVVDEYFDKGIVVFAFAVENIQNIKDFLKTQEVKYPVIPNSMEFGMEHYGGELGYPRIFVIDKYGIVKKVIVGGKSGDYMDLYDKLVPIIEEQLKY